MAIDWDKIYQDFIEWTGRTINTKTVWMNGTHDGPKNTTKPIVNVSVGQDVRDHYDTSSKNASLKDKDIVKHLSKKFKTNFDMLLKTPK